jgi:uncharacterized membrane protein YhaH (DUF805 family)
VILSDLFGLRSPVTRSAYLRWGFGLAALKFAIDTGIVYAFTGKTWSPLGYVVPSSILRDGAVGPAPAAMLFLLPVVALPFLWIGVSMSVRRAIDAGVSAWWGTLFVVPLLNYVVIARLAIPPSIQRPPWVPPELPAYRAAQPPPQESRDTVVPDGPLAALSAIVTSAGIGIAMLFLSVYGLGLYGVALFFLTPFAMGVASAAVYNRRHLRGIGPTLGVATAGVLLAGSIPLLFALEGVLCIAMAAPIAISIALLGALAGRGVLATSGDRTRAVLPLLLILPGTATAESRPVAARGPRRHDLGGHRCASGTGLGSRRRIQRARAAAGVVLPRRHRLPQGRAHRRKRRRRGAALRVLHR